MFDQNTLNILIIIIIAYIVYTLNEGDQRRLRQFKKSKNPSLNVSNVKKFQNRVIDGFVWGILSALILNPPSSFNLMDISKGMVQWSLMFSTSFGIGELMQQQAALV